MDSSDRGRASTSSSRPKSVKYHAFSDKERESSFSDGWIYNWPLGFFDCCVFRHKGKNVACPLFFPLAVCGTCCLLGRVRSHILEEPITGCGMGTQGWSFCLLSVPCKLFEPLGGCCWFVLTVSHLRQQVVNAYNIEDINICAPSACCFTCPPITLPQICVGLLYPCSLFQVYATLLHEEEHNPDNATPRGRDRRGEQDLDKREDQENSHGLREALVR